MTDRAVSTVVGYIVTLGVTAMLVTGLLIAGGNFVQDQRQSTIREELEVVGQRLSGDVSSADRLGQLGTGGTVRIRRAVPSEAAGTSYTIRITDAGTAGPRVVLESGDPTVLVTVPIALSSGTTVDEAAVTAGDVTVTYDPTSSEVSIDDA